MLFKAQIYLSTKIENSLISWPVTLTYLPNSTREGIFASPLVIQNTKMHHIPQVALIAYHQCKTYLQYEDIQ